jgi:Domain of unknown function (DUF6468)
VTLSLALDVVVAGLLIATIAYAAVLDRRIRQLRATRAELETMVVGFNTATARAESAIGDLKSGTEAGSRELKPLIATARQIADDLQFLVERGNELADRLDVGISAARVAAPKTGAKPAARPPGFPKLARAEGERAERSAREVSDAEHALLKALRSVR